MRKIAKNPEAQTPKLYAISMDGNGVESWLADLENGLVRERPVTSPASAYSLKHSSSTLLRAVALTYEALGDGFSEDYAEFTRWLDMLTHWVRGMTAALKMKPEVEDYDIAKKELALYVCTKLERLPGRLTWYDHLCLYIIGEMLEKWGSLRLVSQEGMEAFQKKLNEILRLNNGFANAGAIPKDVKAHGAQAVEKYMERRAKDKPSPARWVFEQALIQQHSYFVDVERARDSLVQADRTCEWAAFVRYWQRYMVCAALRCRLRARMLCGTWQFDRAVGKIMATRATQPDARLANNAGARMPCCKGYYSALLKAHQEYYADVDNDLTADDLDEKEKARQTRRLRRTAYAKLSPEAKLLVVKPWLWRG